MDKYGIDSMMVLNLTRELESRFGELSKTLFFEYQSIGELVPERKPLIWFFLLKHFLYLAFHSTVYTLSCSSLLPVHKKYILIFYRFKFTPFQCGILGMLNGILTVPFLFGYLTLAGSACSSLAAYTEFNSGS